MNYDVLSRGIKPAALIGLLSGAAALPRCQTEALAERRMQAVSANAPTPAPAPPKVATRAERKAIFDQLKPPERKLHARPCRRHVLHRCTQASHFNQQRRKHILIRCARRLRRARGAACRA